MKATEDKRTVVREELLWVIYALGMAVSTLIILSV
jgi:hypothetical protein